MHLFTDDFVCVSGKDFTLLGTAPATSNLTQRAARVSRERGPGGQRNEPRVSSQEPLGQEGAQGGRHERLAGRKKHKHAATPALGKDMV